MVTLPKVKMTHFIQECSDFVFRNGYSRKYVTQ